MPGHPSAVQQEEGQCRREGEEGEGQMGQVEEVVVQEHLVRKIASRIA